VSIETHFRLEFGMQETMKKFMKKMKDLIRATPWNFASYCSLHSLHSFFIFLNELFQKNNTESKYFYLFTYLGHANGKA